MPIHRSLKTFISKAGWHAYNTYRKGVHYPFKLSRVAALLDAPRETIEAFQAKRLAKLLQHAYQTTPYYRELLKTETPDISQIPSLEKQAIREQLENLCSTAFTAKQRIKNATGGSTGTPLVFYQDRNYWNQRNLSVYYFDRWAGWNFGQPQLVIWGAPADLKGDGHWKYRINNFWRNQYWLNGFHLTEKAMLTAFEQMDQHQPQTILAYPSSLYEFAMFLSDNDLTPQWDLKGIISSAEMLHPHYRALIEITFKAKVYNRYGGREVGLIGMECAEGRMHINCRDLYLEIDSPDPYSVPGEILVTQLNNYAMPFIRYRIGDVGMLSDEPCPCGNALPVLAELLGRSTATFRTKMGTLIHGGYFTRQFYGLKGVNQFQIIQETLKHCVLKVVVNRQWTGAMHCYLVRCIQNAIGGDVVVTVEFVEDIPVSASGKREYTISKVGADMRL